MQQNKISYTSYFITLTYDNNHVPRSARKFKTLDKTDIQRFIKRIRKNHDTHGARTNTIKYLCVGEYGTRYLRPHYHIILFNAELKLMFTKEAVRLLENTGFDGKEHVMCEQWKQDNEYIGTCTVGKVEGASIGYTLKYMMKDGKIPLHSKDDRVPEFMLVSKGMGLNYITEAMKAWHRQDINNRMYINVGEGKKASMPRYYKNKIYTDEEREAIAYHQKMEMDKKKIQYQKEMQRLHGDRWHEVEKTIISNRFKKMHGDAIKERKNNEI